jgi:hypothetical protein
MLRLTQDFEPFKYGRSMSVLIAKKLYTSPFVAIREMAVNAWDQYQHESARNKPKEFFITLNPIVRSLDAYDNATGIVVPMDDFKLIAADDPMGGKVVGNQKSTYNQPHETIVGQWHIGKASYIKMSERKEGKVVTFSSNNGKEGNIECLTVMSNGEIGWGKSFTYPQENAHLAKQEIGMAVQVVDVVPELLKIRSVSDSLRRDLGILIARYGFKVFIRDKSQGEEYKPITPPNDLDTKGEVHDQPELEQRNGKYISHCLKRVEKPKWDNIDIYVKYVYIKSIHVDRKVTGWINYNAFNLNLARDGFENDEVYNEAMEKFNKFIAANYEPLDSDKKRGKLQGEKELNEAFAKMLEKVPNLFPSDPLQLSGNQSDSGTAGEVKEGGRNKNWIKQENCKIVENAGDPEESRIIAIGQGSGLDIRGGKGSAKGIEPDGKSTVIRQTDNDKKARIGPVKPRPKTVEGDAEDKPMVFMPDDTVLMLNTSWAAMRHLLYKIKVDRRIEILKPLMAEAVVEHITKKRPEISVPEYRQMVSQLVDQSLAR